MTARNATAKRRPTAAVTALVALLALPALAAGAEDAKPSWSLATRLVADTSARDVGDLLTVVIEEQAEASRAAQSATSKNSSIGGELSVRHPTLDQLATPWTNAVVPSISLDASRSFQGSGSSANSDRLVTRMAARVTEVLPNGNLMIEGRRSMIVQDENVELVLTGTVRQRDIASDNTVSSDRVADASIQYKSSGPIVRSQRMGLLTRFWNWLNPF